MVEEEIIKKLKLALSERDKLVGFMRIYFPEHFAKINSKYTLSDAVMQVLKEAKIEKH